MAKGVEHRVIPQGKEFYKQGDQRPYRVEDPKGLPIKSIPGIKGPNGITSWTTEGRALVWHWGNHFFFPLRQGTSETIYARRSLTKGTV